MRFKLVRRVISMGWSAANTLSAAVFGVLLSIEVVRLCSKELWGSMVEVLLVFGLVSTLMSWGNRNLLLREFSLTPKNIPENWGKSFQARSWLYIIVCLVLVFLSIDYKLKILLFVYLFANFLYKSYDVVIIYKRLFIVSVLLEGAGCLMIAAYILLFKQTMSLTKLTAAFATAEACKSVVVYLLFKKEIKLPAVKFDFTDLLLALPFFLLEFTGLLEIKIDLICVTYFLPKDKIAQYQIYANFLILLQTSSGFVLLPFVKNLYRMNSKSVKKLSYRFFAFGAAIALFSMVFVNYFINYFYHFSIPTPAIVAGVFFVIPTYYYIVIMFQLLKLNKQYTVVILNTVGIIVSFILNIILIPIYGISGAILAIAITQWVLLLIYIAIQKKYVYMRTSGVR